MTVSLDSLKAHLNITFNDDDALLASKLAGAEAWVRDFMGDALDDEAPVPAAVDEAVRQLAAHLYEDREGAESIPASIFDLLTPYRDWAF